ncbi:hypothetical protein BC628DRAFT_1101528 [Trametes gibbosa]|nr:hypothetical protein BC628DRAFT_1101528 [Trametes gibbosa]
MHARPPMHPHHPCRSLPSTEHERRATRTVRSAGRPSRLDCPVPTRSPAHHPPSIGGGRYRGVAHRHTGRWGEALAESVPGHRRVTYGRTFSCRTSADRRTGRELLPSLISPPRRAQRGVPPAAPVPGQHRPSSGVLARCPPIRLPRCGRSPCRRAGCGCGRPSSRAPAGPAVCVRRGAQGRQRDLRSARGNDVRRIRPHRRGVMWKAQRTPSSFLTGAALPGSLRLRRAQGLRVTSSARGEEEQEQEGLLRVVVVVARALERHIDGQQWPCNSHGPGRARAQVSDLPAQWRRRPDRTERDLRNTSQPAPMGVEPDEPRSPVGGHASASNGKHNVAAARWCPQAVRPHAGGHPEQHHRRGGEAAPARLSWRGCAGSTAPHPSTVKKLSYWTASAEAWGP